VARALALLGSTPVAESDILTVAVLTDLERAALPDLKTTPPISLPPVQPPPAAAVPTPIVSPPAVSLDTARAGLSRIILANNLGVSTVVRDDTQLSLSVAEVLAIAQDYSGSHLGEGLARIVAALGPKWPDVKTAVWIGGTGRGLALDTAFRTIPGEQAPDFASLLKDVAVKQDVGQLDTLLAKMQPA
jgi:hypothetical protein